MLLTVQPPAVLTKRIRTADFATVLTARGVSGRSIRNTDMFVVGTDSFPDSTTL